MKHLHFFGCSFTAGDELSDDVWFPWKHECISHDEYYTRRNVYLGVDNNNEKYQKDNKEKAYPAKTQNNEYQTYNHSNNGESLRTCIFRAFQLMFSKNTVDIIFIQIPPIGREFYVNKNGDTSSIQLATVESSLEPIKSYLMAKLNSHYLQQSSVEDCMDMMMLSNVAKQKNIPLYFIECKEEIYTRMIDMLHLDFRFIKLNLRKEINLISFSSIYDNALKENRVLTGKHLDNQAHQEMADKIKNMLPNILNIKA